MLPALHDTGRGPAVVFLHAFPLDASQWDHQVAALSGRYRCMRIDMWGCGSSSEPPSGAPSLTRFAGEVLELLDDRGIERFTVCGLSMGGYVVWELLRLAPQRITGIALCSTRAVADTADGRANRERVAERVLREGVEALVEENVSRLLSRHAQDEVHVADPVRGRIRRCTPEGIAWAARAMAARPDSTALLETVAVRTLVVAGAEDAVIPSSDQRAMAEAIPHARFVEMDECGHLTNLERPARFNDEVQRFLA